MSKITIQNIKEAFWIVNTYLKSFKSMKALIENKRKVFRMTDEEYDTFKFLVSYSRAYVFKNYIAEWSVDPEIRNKFYSMSLSNRIGEIILSDPLCFVPEILDVINDTNSNNLFDDHNICEDFWNSVELFRRLLS